MRFEGGRGGEAKMRERRAIRFASFGASKFLRDLFSASPVNRFCERERRGERKGRGSRIVLYLLLPLIRERFGSEIYGISEEREPGLNKCAAIARHETSRF